MAKQWDRHLNMLRAIRIDVAKRWSRIIIDNDYKVALDEVSKSPRRPLPETNARFWTFECNAMGKKPFYGEPNSIRGGSSDQQV